MPSEKKSAPKKSTSKKATQPKPVEIQPRVLRQPMARAYKKPFNRPRKS